VAQVIGGGNAAVQALIYGDVHPGTQRFFESQRGQGLRQLTDTAKKYWNDLTERFGFMASDRTQRLIREVRRQANWAWHGDFIRPLRTLDDMQLAPPSMIRYVMAEPYARTMYHNHQLAGYDEDYVDLQPGKVGDDHHEYRLVMDGIIQINEEPDEHGHQWHADTWIEEYMEDEPVLDFRDQLDITETWGTLQRLIEKRLEDPTSLRHASLE
jgi:hypothetical protein